MGKVVVLVGTLEDGGAEKQAVMLANLLARRVEVVLAVIHGARVSDKFLARVAGNVALKRVDGSGLSKLVGIFQLFKCERPSAVFSFLAYANVCAVIFGRLCGVSRIYPSIRSAFLSRGKRIAERYFVRPLATRVIFNSERAMAAIFGPDCKDAMVIHNCVEEPRSCRPGRQVGPRPVLITVARFTPVKDIETALCVVALLREWGLDPVYRLVGYGALENEIRKSVRAKGLEDCVEIHVSPPDVEELLASSDIALSTSLAEGLSNALLEAASVGLPIVATNVGDAAAIVDHGVNGFLVAPKDVSGIADSVRKLCMDQSLYLRSHRASLEIAKDRFGEQKFLERYMSLL